jgi:hypothetical protein
MKGMHSLSTKPSPGEKRGSGCPAQRSLSTMLPSMPFTERNALGTREADLPPIEGYFSHGRLTSCTDFDCPREPVNSCRSVTTACKGGSKEQGGAGRLQTGESPSETLCFGSSLVCRRRSCAQLSSLTSRTLSRAYPLIST